MQCWRLREKMLDLFDLTTGGRVIFSVCKVGGVRKDIDWQQQGVFQQTLTTLETELNIINKVFFEDASVRHRLIGVGMLTKEEAQVLGAFGPMMRASGIAHDTAPAGLRCLWHAGF